MKKVAIALLAGLVLSACSSTSEQVVQSETNSTNNSATLVAGVDATKKQFTEEEIQKVMAEMKKQGFRCKREKATGTRLGKKKCSTKKQREQLRLAAEERLRKSRQFINSATADLNYASGG